MAPISTHMKCFVDGDCRDAGEGRGDDGDDDDDYDDDCYEDCCEVSISIFMPRFTY